MLVWAVCRTPRCVAKDVQKHVRLPYLGDSVYLSNALICGHCGEPMQQVGVYLD